MIPTPFEAVPTCKSKHRGHLPMILIPVFVFNRHLYLGNRPMKNTCKNFFFFFFCDYHRIWIFFFFWIIFKIYSWWFEFALLVSFVFLSTFLNKFFLFRCSSRYWFNINSFCSLSLPQTFMLVLLLCKEGNQTPFAKKKGKTFLTEVCNRAASFRHIWVNISSDWKPLTLKLTLCLPEFNWYCFPKSVI